VHRIFLSFSSSVLDFETFSSLYTYLSHLLNILYTMTESEHVNNAPAESTVAEPSPAVPDYLASPNAVFADKDVVWRYGKPPDYSKTRKVWEEGMYSLHNTSPGCCAATVVRTTSCSKWR
jgi:hypothetical protein